MQLLENKEKIEKLEFVYVVYPYCPIGKDNYSAKIKTEIYLNEFYPEYMDLTSALNDLNNQPYTIEQLAEKVCEIIQSFLPLGASITIEANSNKHLDVVVTKTIKRYDIM